MEYYHCKCVQGVVLGSFKGWPFSARLLQDTDAPEVLVRFLSPPKTKELAHKLNREKQPHIRWYAEVSDKNEPVLDAVARMPSDFYVKATIHTILNVAVKNFEEMGLAPPDVCSLCGLPHCDCMGYLYGAFRPLHQGCLDTRLQLPPEDRVLPERISGHVLTGVLGALLGALVAALPIWSLALTNGRIHWALYAFIPLLSGLCYRLFRGKAIHNVASLAVLLSSLAATMLLELVWYWLVLTTTYGTNIPFWQSVQHYFAYHTLFSSLREMLFCLLALFVGFMAVNVFLRRYAENGHQPRQVIRGADYTRSTVCPLCESPVSQDS